MTRSPQNDNKPVRVIETPDPLAAIEQLCQALLAMEHAEPTSRNFTATLQTNAAKAMASIKTIGGHRRVAFLLKWAIEKRQAALTQHVASTSPAPAIFAEPVPIMPAPLPVTGQATVPSANATAQPQQFVYANKAERDKARKARKRARKTEARRITAEKAQASRSARAAINSKALGTSGTSGKPGIPADQLAYFSLECGEADTKPASTTKSPKAKKAPKPDRIPATDAEKLAITIRCNDLLDCKGIWSKNDIGFISGLRSWAFELSPQQNRYLTNLERRAAMAERAVVIPAPHSPWIIGKPVKAYA